MAKKEMSDFIKVIEILSNEFNVDKNKIDKNNIFFFENRYVAKHVKTKQLIKLFRFSKGQTGKLNTILQKLREDAQELFNDFPKIIIMGKKDETLESLKPTFITKRKNILRLPIAFNITHEQQVSKDPVILGAFYIIFDRSFSEEEKKRHLIEQIAKAHESQIDKFLSLLQYQQEVNLRDSFDDIADSGGEISDKIQKMLELIVKHTGEQNNVWAQLIIGKNYYECNCPFANRKYERQKKLRQAILDVHQGKKEPYHEDPNT